MKTFTQRDVDLIVKRAKKLGASNGCSYKNGHLSLSIYGKPHNASVLASLIINGWHDKFDLIYATQALTEFLTASYVEETNESSADLESKQMNAIRHSMS